MKHLLSIALLFIGNAAFAQMPPPPPAPIRMISVSGEAHGQFAPDQAVLSLSLISHNPNLVAAKKENDGKLDKLVAIAREFKIAKEDIAASNVSISPEYKYDNNQQQFVGYMVNRSVTLTLQELAIHERVLSAIVDAEIDQVNGIEFTLKNPEDAAMKLRAKAVANAKATAEALAQAAGVKLGQPIAISEGGASMPMPPQAMMAMRADVAMEKSSVAPSLPGLIKLSQSVNVTFGLE